MKFENFSSRCFLCGIQYPTFDTEMRVCNCIRPYGFPEYEIGCYVTILPEMKSYSVVDLPSLWAAKPNDVFAVAATNLGVSSEVQEHQRNITETTGNIYPFAIDHLKTKYHLQCGNAVLYRSTSLEGLTGSEVVLILDMGSYYWSGTLKDPRSWVIINTALAFGMTEIAVWTAGNAGVSLAKIACGVNKKISSDARLQVHAIVDNEVAPEIRSQLKLWQCEVLDIFRQDRPVLNPTEIRTLVEARLRRSRRHLNEAAYWHVTDGWDGVGLLMYRLIAAQVIRDVAAVLMREGSIPMDIVLPVGTGDLLLGFYLGLRDCEEAGLVPTGLCRLVGAVPAGANILANVRRRSIPQEIDDSLANPKLIAPIMPKLRSLYTPLAPCLAHIEKLNNVSFTVVTEADQLRAGRLVLSGGIDDGIVAEPSALATFGALPYLSNGSRIGGRDNGRTYCSNRRFLFINSGLGVLSASEQAVLQRAMGL